MNADPASPTAPELDATLAEAGLALRPEERAHVLAMALRLDRAAARIRDYLADHR